LTSGGAKNTRNYFGQRDVFVDAGGAVGAVAVAEGDLAQQEVLFELGPFFAAGGAQLPVRSLLAAAFDEGFVGGDEVLGEHGGVAAGGVEAEVSDMRVIASG
jgi:hypothetical protein